MSEPDDVQLLIQLLDPRLANDQTDLYRRALEQFDRVILKRALDRCEGNLTARTALLGSFARDAAVQVAIARHCRERQFRRGGN